MKMNKKIENSLNLLLDTAKTLGAECTTVIANENTSVNVAARLGKLEKFIMKIRKNFWQLGKLRKLGKKIYIS